MLGKTLTGIVIAVLLSWASLAHTQPPKHLVVTIKERLQKNGYDPGPPNDNWDSKTSEILKQYQIDHKLPVTGDLNPQTAESLGIPVPPGQNPPTQTSSPPPGPSPPANKANQQPK